MAYEIPLSKEFIEDFFEKVLEARKHPAHHPIGKRKEKENLHLGLNIEEPLESLENRAEQIQTLQVKEPQVPMPVLISAKPVLHVPVPEEFAPIPKIPSFKNLSFFDLSRINDFVTDSQVTLIQCDGPKLPVKITKNNQVIQTNTSLAEEEIKSIIHKFSFRAQQPISQPVFRCQVDNLAITAVTSDFSTPRFVIVKK